MLRSWFGYFSRESQISGTRKRPQQARRLLRVEALESRQMLSASVPGFATTNLRHVAPLAGVTPLSTSGPTGMTPQQIRQAYGFDQQAGDGSGTTIAIVDAYDDPTIANDLHQFDLRFGLPDPVFTKVNQIGGATPPTADKGWASEIALDVEWAHAIAPGANILLVEANSSSFSDLLKAVDIARNTPNVVTVSMSWGGGEFSGEQTYDSHFTTPAGHVGVSFFVSSGDAGAPTSYPATSPNVVSVGGTTLTLAGGKYGSEAGWSGSGGGISSYETQPTYQKGLVTQSTTMRTNPDVAYDSDPNSGFPVYDSYNNGTSIPWGQWGGTSDAAPQWAALVAIADQGRASVGLGSLDGTKQLLPALYQLPAGDFHDVVTGTSTGSPNYKAGTGYDLVTGRGSPIANLVIADLIGQPVVATATHLAVTTSATATAGTTSSVTVTALTATNASFTGYLGTVHFTSTDLGAGVVLPADYTFTAADHGTHTFTGLKLVTASTQTITVRDTSNSSLLGSAQVLVSPGAVTHVTFGQQPSNATVNSSINPAVTVRLLDAYNNLVTTDNSDKVTLTLVGGAAGASLSGSATTTASGGVATFANVAVSLAGNSYQLVARTGSLPAITSAAFNVTAAALSGQIEGFATTSLAAYVGFGARTSSAVVSSAAAHDGTYGLADTNGNDWIYRNDTAAHVQAGDTISVWLKFSSTAQGRAYFGFGTSATGTLALTAAPNSSQLILQAVDFTQAASTGGTFTDLAAVSQTWSANQWYRLEVNWSSSGQIVGRLFAADGVTQLNAVQGNQLLSGTNIVAGGIGFRAIGTGDKYWDSVQLTPGVNTFALTIGSTGSTSGGSGTGSIGGWWWDPRSGWLPISGSLGSGGKIGSLFGAISLISEPASSATSTVGSTSISLILSNPLTARIIDGLFGH